jgi:hypothetical protein
MKHALCFLAGTVLSTIAVVLNGGRPLGMVALGFLLAASILTGIAYLAGIDRVVRVLNALNDSAPAEHPVARRRVSDASGYVKPSKKRQIQDVADAIEEYKMRQSERHPATARTPEVAAFLNDPELFDSTVQ